MVTEHGKEGEVPVEPASQETPTPTVEEQLKSLQTQLQGLTQEKERLESGYKGLQRTLSEKDRELKRQAAFDTKVTGIQDSIETLATYLQASRETEETEQPRKRVDLVAEVRKRRETQDSQSKTEEVKRLQAEYNQKADALYARAKTIFGEDDDAIERIEDWLGNGRLDRAEAKVEKAEKAKTTKKENVETEEQRIERLAQEKAQAYLKEKGLLDEHTNYPQGGGGGTLTYERIKKMTPDEIVRNAKEIAKLPLI